MAPLGWAAPAGDLDSWARVGVRGRPVRHARGRGGNMTEADAKPRLVGMNHVALEVGDIEQALAFYGRIFTFTLRGKSKDQAFIDMGDQFLALMQVKEPHHDRHRHFGVVVDDRSKVRDLAKEAGAEFAAGPFLDF